jgi:ABC-type Fe3+-citrate transport system substrate-binding protein
MAFGVEIPAHKDAMNYIIDPKAVDIRQFDSMIQAFKENGFDLKFSEEYKANVLHKLGITLASSKGSSSTSATSQFNIDEMQNGKQYIKVVADKATGDIAIVTVPKFGK